MTDSLDLSTIFNEVAKTLVQNQEDLNAADTYNHDHGTNMVQTFKTVQKAVAKQKDKPVSEQLAYASETLKKKSTSGSAQIYAEGLANAATQFQGKELTRLTAGTLINAMMGMQGGVFLSDIRLRGSSRVPSGRSDWGIPASNPKWRRGFVGQLAGWPYRPATGTSNATILRRCWRFAFHPPGRGSAVQLSSTR